MPEPMVSSESPTDFLAAVTPPRRQSLPSSIADELRGVIARHGRPGARLASERELLDRYGVARPTLREALHVLESEGLIVVRRGGNGGIFVAESSMPALARSFGVLLRRDRVSLRDVFTARQAIESAAARLAAEGRASAALEQLLLHEQHVLSEGGEFPACEVAFHETLLIASGSVALAHLGQLLEMTVARHAADSMAVYRRDHEEDIHRTNKALHRAHRLIVEAIASGDAATAERRMRSHLIAVLNESLIDPAETADIFDS